MCVLFQGLWTFLSYILPIVVGEWERERERYLYIPLLPLQFDLILNFVFLTRTVQPQWNFIARETKKQERVESDLNCLQVARGYVEKQQE